MSLIAERFLHFIHNQKNGRLKHLLEWLSKPAVRGRVSIFIVLVSLGFIGLIVLKNWGVFTQSNVRFNYWYILASLLSFPLGFFPTVIAWHHLIMLFGIKLPFKKNLEIYCISALPRHVPGIVLYVSSRSIQYETLGISTRQVVTATAFEVLLLSLVGCVTALLVFGFTWLAGGSSQGMLVLAAALVILLIFTFASFRFISNLGLKKAQLDIRLLQFDARRLAITLVWMLAAWLGGGCFLYLLCNTLLPLNIHFLPLMVGIWGASGAMSMTIGAVTQGFGVREVTMGTLMTMVVSPVIAVVLAVVFRVVFTLSELFWVGVVLLIMKKPLFFQKKRGPEHT